MFFFNSVVKFHARLCTFVLIANGQILQWNQMNKIHIYGVETESRLYIQKIVLLKGLSSLDIGIKIEPGSCVGKPKAQGV